MGRSTAQRHLSTPEDKDKKSPVASTPHKKGREEPLVFNPTS